MVISNKAINKSYVFGAVLILITEIPWTLWSSATMGQAAKGVSPFSRTAAESAVSPGQSIHLANDFRKSVVSRGTLKSTATSLIPLRAIMRNRK
ncbi:hypothetical protein BgiBS90_029264 [Biomphalaria glabrata]|nr:hypothetical protein BgiBS90_029264 [Biomphalaria glabrata]